MLEGTAETVVPPGIPEPTIDRPTLIPVEEDRLVTVVLLLTVPVTGVVRRLSVVMKIGWSASVVVAGWLSRSALPDGPVDSPTLSVPGGIKAPVTGWPGPMATVEARLVTAFEWAVTWPKVATPVADR